MTNKTLKYLQLTRRYVSVLLIASMLVGCDNRQKVETIEFRNESSRAIHVDSVSGFQHIPPAGWLNNNNARAVSHMSTMIDGHCELKWGYGTENEYPYPAEYFTYHCDLSTLPQTDLRRLVFTFGDDLAWSISAWPED